MGISVTSTRAHGLTLTHLPVLGALPEVLEHGGDVEAVLELVVVARVLHVAVQEQQRRGQCLLFVQGGVETRKMVCRCVDRYY